MISVFQQFILSKKRLTIEFELATITELGKTSFMSKKSNYHYINDRELNDRTTALRFTIRRQKGKRDKIYKALKESRNHEEQEDFRQKIDSLKQTIVMTEMELCYAERELEHRNTSKELQKVYQEKIKQERKEFMDQVKKEEENLPDQNHPMFRNEVPDFLR